MIKWGIIGLGNIALRFAKSLSYSADGVLYAVASRQEAKLRQYKEWYPSVNPYGSYEALIMDPELDAVYIALPHSMHKEYTKMALSARKAVLCEKPAALSLNDAEEMVACAAKEKTFFMEAMKTRFVPAMPHIKVELDNHRIGQIKRIQAGFGSDISQRRDMEGKYIENPLEGGALYDLGSYPVAFLLDLLGDNIKKAEGSVEKDENGLIQYASGELICENGAVGFWEVAIDRKLERTAVITGTRGIMEIPMWNRPEEYRIKLLDGEIITGGISLVHDDMFGEIEEVHHCLNKKQLVSNRYSWDDTLRTMKILEELN